MKNIIDAIINLVTNPKVELVRHYSYINRANTIGDAFEEYIKDLFAGTVDEIDDNIRNYKLSEVFSYIGNQTNPPHIMLKNVDDAIDVKKLKSINDLTFNSSNTNRILKIDNPKINSYCRNCEKWSERDMLYVFGVFETNKIKQLCMIYGTEYFSDIETYKTIESVDPLGIINIQIRGMRVISTPLKVFNYIYTPDCSKTFNLMCLINCDKYATLENAKELEYLTKQISDLNIKDVKVKNPNSPVELIDCKLITFAI